MSGPAKGTRESVHYMKEEDADDVVGIILTGAIGILTMITLGLYETTTTITIPYKSHLTQLPHLTESINTCIGFMLVLSVCTWIYKTIRDAVGVPGTPLAARGHQMQTRFLTWMLFRTIVGFMTYISACVDDADVQHAVMWMFLLGLIDIGTGLVTARSIWAVGRGLMWS